MQIIRDIIPVKKPEPKVKYASELIGFTAVAVAFYVFAVLLLTI